MEDYLNEANRLKKIYEDELKTHRSSGNYKYEITPNMIKDAFLLGIKFNLNKK